MGKQCGPYFITGTYCNICFYRMEGKYYVRMKSSLTGKRVKKDPAFACTMQYAQLLGRASKIASRLYRALPKETREFSQYRALTGKAMQLLKEGLTDAAALALLQPRRQELKGVQQPAAAPVLHRPEAYADGVISRAVKQQVTVWCLAEADDG
jgi:hypothetical protein